MVDFNYYKAIHLGEKVDSESAFRKLLRKSRRVLDNYTMDRIKDVEDEEVLELIRVTLCELIDIEYEIEKLESMGEIKSITQGKRAISYYTPNEMGLGSISNKRYSVIRENLLFTGLLTRSVMR